MTSVSLGADLITRPAAVRPFSVTRPNRTLPLVVLQLLLVLWVAREFELEERRGLSALLLLATVGVVIHNRLQHRLRQPFFLLLSLVSFPLAFAWPMLVDASVGEAALFGCQQAAAVFALGLILIALCHLPVGFRKRVLLIGISVVCLSIWRWQAVTPFWAVFGSVFMFRLWVYLKAISNETASSPWTQRLSYFFLLSNGFFPFFPIIDFRKFRDGYVALDDGQLSQRGMAWILRGIIHLLLYRAIKTFWLPGTADLIDAEYLALFLVANYALYLRISGHFHIITGLLHLFGYDLPRTHDRYFLASSFSDIWRRINIYWKDFLADQVFFPVYFSLARLPKAAAMVIGVLATFTATWFLHSWQVFWLLGRFPIGFRDALLWLTAGSLVAINSVWQYHCAARRPGQTREVTLASAFRLSTQVAATFLCVSFFWACWTIPYFPQRVISVASTGGFSPPQLLRLSGILCSGILVGTAAKIVIARVPKKFAISPFSLEQSPAICIALLGTLVFLTIPPAQRLLGPAFAPKLAALSVETSAALQLADQARGYYESLAEANLQSNPLLDHGKVNHEPSGGEYWEGTRQRGDALGTELIPGWQGIVRGVPTHINRWGMRDDDLPRRKPSGTYRIAMLGSSVTMGYGVPADSDFESLLEWRLNANRQPQGPRIELLNFAVGGYFALHSAITLQEKVFPFAPDAVIYVAHQGELYGPPRHLGSIRKGGHALPYPCLDSIIRAAGVTQSTSWGTTELLLQPHARAIVACTYQGMVGDCRTRGVLPIWVYVPLPGIAAVSADADDMLQLGREAGFAVIDLSDWAAGYEPHEVKFSANDFHLNELGHRLIADRLYQELRMSDNLLPPWFAAAVQPQ